MIGVGLIGCGKVSRRYLDLPEGMQLIAATDQIRERAEATGAEVCDSVGELLDRRDIDLVVIASPSGLHAELGIAAAMSGKHVLVEKPIDVDPFAARLLVDTCHEYGVVLSVVAQHRFDPDAILAKELIDDGMPVVVAHGQVWWERPPDYYSGWRGTRALDGGVLMQQGIHTVDLMLWLLGPVSTLSASAATVAHEMEMEDVLVAALRFQQGTLGTLSVTTASSPQTAGYLSLAGPRGGCSIKLTDSGWHRAQLLDVARAIETGTAPLVTGEDGLAALDLVIAAYCSAGLR